MPRVDPCLDAKRRLLRVSAGRSFDLGAHRRAGNDDTVSGARAGTVAVATPAAPLDAVARILLPLIPVSLHAVTESRT